MATRATQAIQNGLETTHQDAVSATGNGTAAIVNGFGSIAFQITGTFSATITFEASVDGTNYATIAVIDSDGDRVTSATSAGLYRADIAGYKSVRAPAAWTSGTSVTVKSLALPGQMSDYNLGVKLDTIINDGVKQSGNIVTEQLDETDAVSEVLTFAETIESIEIYHDEATPQDFVVNGLTLTIKPGGWRSLIGGTPSAEVTIPTGVTCTVTRLV